MRFFVYVEGMGDKLALEALWDGWRKRLGAAGHGITILELQGKSKLLQKIGHRAARHLVDSEDCIVIGLPDLYPAEEYENTDHRHSDEHELMKVQTRRVKEALQNVFHIAPEKSEQYLERFWASAFKHDMEMLLLAAQDGLRGYLGAKGKLGSWRRPVEDQDQQKPPKQVVKGLFMSIRGKAYRDTKDAGAILRKVSDLKEIVFEESGHVKCPLFKSLMDRMGNRAGIQAY